MPALPKRQLALSQSTDAGQPARRARATRDLPAGEPLTAQNLEGEDRRLNRLVADAFAFIEKKLSRLASPGIDQESHAHAPQWTRPRDTSIRFGVKSEEHSKSAGQSHRKPQAHFDNIK